MRILIAGPIETAALARATGLDLRNCPPGITQTPVVPIVAGMLAHGLSIHLITLDPSIDSTQTFVQGALTLTYCPLRGSPQYRARVRSRDLFEAEIRYMARVMRDSHADIIHAHWTYEYAEAALRSGKPTVATMHDLGWDCLVLFRDAYRTMRLAMKYRAMVRLRHVTAVSPFVAGKAWRYGHFNKVDVVPNPVSYVRWITKKPVPPVIVTVGDNGPIKNVEASVAAFALIRVHFPDAELHLFGPGLDFKNGSESGVHFHGNVPHDVLMTFLKNNANLLIHSSKLETFGVILAEAKMRGVPVVAGRKSGGVGYVVNDAGGVLVDIASPEAIANAAIQTLSNAKRYAQMQVDAHADALERFSETHVIEQYVKIYQRILRN